MTTIDAYREPESCLDVRYVLDPRIVASIRSADSVTISGARPPLELPLALFRVLMAFAEPRTARQAFDLLEVEVDVDEFGRIIGDLVEQDLLKPDQPSDDRDNLRQLLSSRIFSDPAVVGKLGRWMQSGRAIIIPDALPPDLAEGAHNDLSASTEWTATEGHHDFFHYRASIVARIDGRTPALTRCIRLFRSSATRHFMTELSGQDCMGEAGVVATWYRANEYALPHDDSSASEPRSVAYVWYLVKDWQREWGGSFFWCPTGQYLSPQFNMLVLFNVMPSNVHFVCPVAPTATAKRLAISGFWHRSAGPSPSPPVCHGAFISPQAYGQPASPDPELSSVIVL
jgi:hypothetical protein